MTQENGSINNATFANVKADTLYFGSAMVLAQLFVGGSLMERDWQIRSLLVLVGFAAYQLLIAQFFDSGKLTSGRVKAALDDVLKVGTMLVVARLLSGGSLTDMQWVKEASFMLVGFVTYDLVTYYVYDTSALEKRAGSSVNDFIKFGTMFVVMQWLLGKPFDKHFALDTAGYIAGLVAYEYLFLDRV